jgi:Ca2+-binding EF-hand superfamily protein
MKKTILSAGIIAVALGGMIAGTAALAKQHGGMERPSFEQLDTNADGQITQEEMQARGEARFAMADTDSDGKLSAEEMMASRAKAGEDCVKRMIEKRDTDGDGFLSLEEMRPNGDKQKKGKGRGFERMDADKDGAISKEEFDTAMAKHGKRKGKRGDKPEQN